MQKQIICEIIKNDIIIHLLNNDFINFIIYSSFKNDSIVFKTLISNSLSIAKSSTSSISQLQNAINTLDSLIPQLNSENVISLAKDGINAAKDRISELNAPVIPSGSTNIGTAIKTFTMESTAYYGHTITAMGSKPVRNPNGISTVAVDPNVIPLGSKVYVSGYGVAIAADTGGAIKGNIIDVYVTDHQKALELGVVYKDVYMKMLIPMLLIEKME